MELQKKKKKKKIKKTPKENNKGTGVTAQIWHMSIHDRQITKSKKSIVTTQTTLHYTVSWGFGHIYWRNP